jgi:transposase
VLGVLAGKWSVDEAAARLGMSSGEVQELVGRAREALLEETRASLREEELEAQLKELEEENAALRSANAMTTSLLAGAIKPRPGGKNDA